MTVQDLIRKLEEMPRDAEVNLLFKVATSDGPTTTHHHVLGDVEDCTWKQGFSAASAGYPLHFLLDYELEKWMKNNQIKHSAHSEGWKKAVQITFNMELL